MGAELRDVRVETELVDDGLEHRLGGGERRVRLDLVGDVRAGVVDVAVVVLRARGTRRGAERGEHLGGGRVLRWGEQRVRAHGGEDEHEGHDDGDDVLADNPQQVHDGDPALGRRRGGVRRNLMLLFVVLCGNQPLLPLHFIQVADTSGF